MKFFLYLIIVINAETYDVKKIKMKNFNCNDAFKMKTFYKQNVGYIYQNKLVMGYYCMDIRGENYVRWKC